MHVSDEVYGAPARGWFIADVAGASMLPTLRAGDLLVVRVQRAPAAYRRGQLALVHFEARPGLVMVKRVHEARPGGLWVAGDNLSASDASEKFGLAHPLGRVVARLWPRPSLLRRRGGRPGGRG